MGDCKPHLIIGCLRLEKIGNIQILKWSNSTTLVVCSFKKKVIYNEIKYKTKNISAMGKICKYANLYDSSGKLIEKAPIKTKVPQGQPVSHKYPGGSLYR